jgi:Bacterial PH domain
MSVVNTEGTLVREAARSQLGGMALPNSGHDRVATGPGDNPPCAAGHHHGVSEKSTENSPGSTESAETGPAATPSAAAVPAGLRIPRKLVFRVPGSAYIGVVFLIMCSSFVAAASPWAILVYLLPVGVAVWLWRTRTEVDADRLVIRRVLTRTVLPWSEVASLRLADRHWIRAVRTGGGEITLPTVRTRHLSGLALISGGRITDPMDQSVSDDEPAQGPV